MPFFALVVLLAVVSTVSGKIYFKEDFNDKSWESRWTVPSDWKPKVIVLDFLASHSRIDHFLIIKIFLFLLE